jgi:hypothetical protein
MLFKDRYLECKYCGFRFFGWLAMFAFTKHLKNWHADILPELAFSKKIPYEVKWNEKGKGVERK